MAAYTATWCQVTSGPVLLPSTLPEFVTLLEPGSMLTSMAFISTKDHTDARGLGHHLRPS